MAGKAPAPGVIRMPESKGEPALDVWADDGTFDTAKAALIFAETENWPDAQRVALLARLRAAEARAAVKAKYAHPGEIAQAVDESYVLTPALDLISQAIERVITSPRKINLLITMPPQEGKSTTAAVWSPIRALQVNPDMAIVLATYAQALAETHSRTIRGIIDSHGTGVTDSLTGLPVTDQIGLKLARGANQVSQWSVEGGDGGFVAVGIGGTLTGRRADLMIIDDPFKNMMEADSKTHREKVHTWFSTVALTRLSPSASVILIQTRWHPQDLAGNILAGEKLLPKAERTWRHLNIPAIAEEGIPDALNRTFGEPMVSARDTPEAKRDFAATRRQVGERTWYALYQGSPKNPAGGLFMRQWFDPHLPEPPLYPVASIVGIDPADSGEGDESGIIGGMLTSSGVAVLTHDRSGQFTSDQWARAGVMLALEIGALEVVVEGYTTSKTYMQAIRRAYSAIHREAFNKAQRGEALTPIDHRALPDLPPFRIRDWRGGAKIDAVGRSTLLRQSLETKKCRTVEYAMAVFEEQACDWQAGQHQPDRVAAAVIAHDRLAALAGAPMTIATPTQAPASGPPAWMTRKIG